MKPSKFSYQRVTTIQEAVEALGSLPEAHILAGGQSLVPLMNLRLAAPGTLIDINGVGEMSGITTGDSYVRLGGLTRHAEIEDSPLLRREFSLLPFAASKIGYRQIRHRGTIGGSICHGDPAAEWPSVSMALDAEFELTSIHGKRRVAAADFFDGYFQTARREDELLTAVEIPWNRASWGYQAETRRGGDFAVVAAIALLDGTPEECTSARIVLTGCASRPIRLRALESMLVGTSLRNNNFHDYAALVAGEIDPPNDLHGSSVYRARLAGVLVRRALTEALDRLESKETR